VTRRTYARAGRGFAAIGIWHPKTKINVGSLWRSAFLFDCAFVFTVGHRYTRQASDTIDTPQRTPMFHFTDLDDLVTHLPWSCPLVGVELDPRAEHLASFVHPERACYLLGAEDHGLPVSVLDQCHYLTQVETVVSQSMNVACAGSILLHDRHAKSAATRPVRVP
jgi:tRNA G18 (ribose-2'-O)-methylase SpoU